MIASLAVTAIGGGHGLARTLEALLHLGVQPTAVVTVADDGGSSGRLRQEHGILALGDMRMALQTLAGSASASHGWAGLFGHRFGDGDLEGHALGNLVLLALLERHHGDVTAAVRQAARLLGCRGQVVPCTTDDVTLVARVDEVTVEGQVAIQTTPGRHHSVWLEPRHPQACDDAVRAVDEAEVLLIGPGSLYTSLIPNLLVPGIATAVARSAAPLLYVANLTCQPGETSGMTLEDHVKALLAYLPDGRPVDIVVHDGPDPLGAGPPLTAEVDIPRVARVHRADLALRRPDGTVVAAHDPKRLAQVLDGLLG